MLDSELKLLRALCKMGTERKSLINLNHSRESLHHLYQYKAEVFYQGSNLF